ncbi:hypothetical protein J1N35_013515 [Gossypium stocksii]|uniref:Aminotransferase-like plant mobile domain-containing protein n=1 Tax=Gossypium stocksii TaxID=47602 RepID=A0A9D3VU80_9ROSI|nr:hypothetical protein J1N35_013515 [Gossypium stocksii]
MRQQPDGGHAKGGIGEASGRGGTGAADGRGSTGVGNGTTQSRVFVVIVFEDLIMVPKIISSRALRGRVNSLGYSSDEQLIPYLELARYGSAALVRTFDLQYDLISTLVECWRPETHTFHLPCGECTVILENVALQLGLSIDGSAVTGVSAIAVLAALCYSLLGDSSADDESNFMGLKFT